MNLVSKPLFKLCGIMFDHVLIFEIKYCLKIQWLNLYTKLILHNSTGIYIMKYSPSRSIGLTKWFCFWIYLFIYLFFVNLSMHL